MVTYMRNGGGRTSANLDIPGDPERNLVVLSQLQTSGGLAMFQNEDMGSLVLSEKFNMNPYCCVVFTKARFPRGTRNT